MGIQTNALRFLLLARAMGADFERTATIGRQTVRTTFDQAQTVLRSEWNTGIDPATLNAVLRGEYVDELLRYLGADDVHSFDYSGYEGATHLHDFNHRIDPMYYGKYSVVLDGGSLEHVFNFPIAIENCMRMLRVGGCYLGITPTNNFNGHGLYQFSPELYFRVFSPENGFRTEHILLVQGSQSRRWFRVADPRMVKQRFRLENSRRSLLYVFATKVADCEPFGTPPQQSDYVNVWETARPPTPRAATRRNRLEARMPPFLPGPVREILDWYEDSRWRLFRQRKRLKRFLTPFDPTRGAAELKTLADAASVAQTATVDAR